MTKDDGSVDGLPLTPEEFDALVSIDGSLRQQRPSPDLEARLRRLGLIERDRPSGLPIRTAMGNHTARVVDGERRQEDGHREGGEPAQEPDSELVRLREVERKAYGLFHRLSGARGQLSDPMVLRVAEELWQEAGAQVIAYGEEEGVKHAEAANIPA